MKLFEVVKFCHEWRRCFFSSSPFPACFCPSLKEVVSGKKWGWARDSSGVRRIGNENQPKVFLHKVFPNPGRPDPNPGTSRPLRLKQQKKATCIKFLSTISRRLGPWCPRNIPPKNFMFRLLFRSSQRVVSKRVVSKWVFLDPNNRNEGTKTGVPGPQIGKDQKGCHKRGIHDQGASENFS